MIGFKVFFLLFITLCESKKSLVPQAILQLVKSHYGEYPVKIEVIYNLDRIKILPETLKLLSDLKELKVTNVAKELEDYVKPKNREKENVAEDNTKDDDEDDDDDDDHAEYVRP